LLANAARDYHFDYEQVQGHFTKKEGLEDFKSLLLFSLALYQYYHLSFAWSNQLKKTLSPEESDRMKELKHLLAHGNEVLLGNRRLIHSG